MNKTIRILGIDPGINNTGYSLGIFDIESDTITIKEYGVFCASAIAKKKQKEDYKVFGTVISYACYAQKMKSLIDTYKPDYVVSESAFYNPRMPNAYLSLSLCINTIRNVLYEYRKVLYTIAPKEAKQTVATATSDKAAIQESIHNLDDLHIRHTDQKSVEKMVEHEADSIAILYTFCKKTLRTLLLNSGISLAETVTIPVQEESTPAKLPPKRKNKVIRPKVPAEIPKPPRKKKIT